MAFLHLVRDPLRRLIPAFVLAAGGVVGCQGPPSSASTDSELRAELGLPEHASIHRVDLTVAGDRVRILPLRTRVRPGDVVQFRVLDHRSHLVRFEDEEMEGGPLAFLVRTDQDRPPPLTEREARWVLSLSGAPPGLYPFRVESSGFTVRGEILVDPD